MNNSIWDTPQSVPHNNARPGNSGKGKKFIVLVVVFIVLLALIAIGWFFLSGRSTNHTADSAAQFTVSNGTSEKSVEKSSVTSVSSTYATSAQESAQPTSNAKEELDVVAVEPAVGYGDCNALNKVEDGGNLIFQHGDSISHGESGDTVVSFCDGQWAKTGLYASDSGRGLQHWTGTEWEYVRSAGTTSGMGLARSCWDKQQLISMGIPGELLADVVTCDAGDVINNAAPSAGSNSAGVSSLAAYEQPQCDGHYILIVDNVVFAESTPYEAQTVQERLSAYPGAKTTKPGACPSLRAWKDDSQGRSLSDAGYDGGYIIPIYYDYGSDKSAVCSAQQNYPGSYARVLSNQAEYLTPCG
ncbi:hypothetical protein EML15_06680 [Corynebacterium sp. sy017]|uniref:hypothetical protein n=1 Tax=unclassified Corynebacterium TaxID=2624378 RepID=UPI00118648BB|nr:MULTISPECIES: hypothetical protein [unclassified Corynebacterium]MBP3088827.1 hypothetical protein [Corynebacterium sp. sy017]TSD91170.1 hypothetical protein ELY17_06690 [Corynebacterium sp. SY003]